MKKILAIRNDRFGEFILNIPALRALKESFPGVQLHVLVAPEVEELARLVPAIDRIWVRKEGPQPFLKELAFAWQLAREKYDAAVVLNPSRSAHHIVFLAGIPKRFGYARKDGFLLTRTIKDDKDLGRRHEVESNLRLVELMGASTADRSLQLAMPAETVTAVLKKFGIDPAEPLLAVHPWTSDPVKQWPLENFEKLIESIAKIFTGRILVLGRPERWHREIALSGHPYLVDLEDRTTLVEAAAILSRCGCLVSGDSGPVHLACAVNTPVVALFRNDVPGKNPERWGPWGRGSVVIQKSRLEDITVREVVESVEAVVNQKS